MATLSERTSLATLSQVVSILALAVCTLFMYEVGGNEAASGAFFCLLMVVICAPYNVRQQERMRHGREVLDRFSPERSRRPLGL